MFASPSTLLLGLTLLAEPSPVPACETGTRRIELDADASHETSEVCIRPELAINLFFDTTLARVEIEGRERFRRVMVTDDTLTLVASEALHDGARVPVTVFFQDGNAPATITLLLVVHPSQAERQVEVFRHARTLASYRQGESQARAEAQQCQEEKARMQSECGEPIGLMRLIAQGWIGKQGVVAQGFKGIPERPGALIIPRKGVGYRTIGDQGQGQVALKLDLLNRGTRTWTPAGAALLDEKQVPLPGLRMGHPEPIHPGKSFGLIVEAEAGEREAQGPFTLKVWAEEADAETVVLENLHFPSSPMP